MKVLSVASEIFPLVKTGGLADVAGALPAALAPKGVAMTSFMPGYPAVMAAMENGRTIHAFQNLFGGAAHLVRGKAKGLDLIALDAPHLFKRDGNPYLGPDGKDWADNPARYGALAFAAAELGLGRVAGEQYEILHLHDWQAALAAVYVKYAHGVARKPRTIMTVHITNFCFFIFLSPIVY